MTALETLSDADLARRIAGAGGEPRPEEEGELCRRYAPRLLAFARRRLSVGERSGDLAQETLLITLAKLRGDEVREPERIGSFILGVARTLASSQRSRESRLVSLGDADRQLVAASTLPGDPIARQRVRGCLEGLPDTQRAVVVLTFYGEQTSAHIAASLGLSPENVRVIRHRGVARLRDCLGLEERPA